MKPSSSYFRFDRSPASIDALDGLRAIAIILVLFRHGIRPYADAIEGAVFPLWGWDFATPLLNGWVGVDLFFILSGFLISHHLLRQQGTGFSYLTYLWRRILRILPSYYAVLWLAAFGVFPGFIVAQEFLGGRIFYHMMFLQDLLPSNIIVAFWSLGVEEKFYLVAPFLVLGLGRLRTKKRQYALLCGLAFVPLSLRLVTAFMGPVETPYLDFFETYRSPFYMCFEGLLVGMGCALILRDFPTPPVPANKIFFAGITGVAILIIPVNLVDNGAGWFDKTGLQTLLAISFGAITLGAIYGGGPQKFLSSTFFLVIARLSYTLYLVHMALIPLSFALARLIFGDELMTPSGFFLFFPIFILVSTVFSMMLHFGIEKPFLSLKDHPRKFSKLTQSA